MTTTPPFAMTPKAIEMAKKKLLGAEDGILGLRVGLRGGGCSGYSYVFETAKEQRPERDLALDFDGLTIIVDTKSLELLKGATLDWETKLMGHGFKWINPNAKTNCGCGESVSF